MSPAEIVNVAEFHVYERALYKVGAPLFSDAGWPGWRQLMR